MRFKTASLSWTYTSQPRLYRELVANDVPEKKALWDAQSKYRESPKLYIDEDEAKVVREVFQRYVEGREGTRQIANDLNSRGLRRRGRKWHPFHIVKMLHDPKLAGFTTFDEEAYERRRPSSAPVHEQEPFEGKHDAIISESLYEKAKRILAFRKGQINVSRADARVYPLTGVLQCLNGHSSNL